MTYRSEDDKLWVELFKVALAATAVVNFTAEEIVADAAAIADAALPKVKERMAQQDVVNTTHVPARALFAPLLEKERAKREQDEADSGFGVAT